MRLYLSSFRVGNRPDELLRLLRGGRRTALILNADDYKNTEDRAVSLSREIGELESLGLEPIEVDLRDYFGRAEALSAALAGFDLIYVRGGSAFVLRRAFRQSGADELIKDLLARDAVVYAGYSAGPVMLGPTLCGIDGHIDDPTIVPEGYEDAPPTWDCLNVLPYTIAPHYKSDHPESAEIDRSVEYFIENHIPFIALRDGEAIVVDDDEVAVVG
ncbi:MAG: Type 1 glutamine amidotransferase-like domain-containing protein [Egibacteraceae bacterium]